MTAGPPGPILIVEDDATLAGLLDHHLRARGYEVRRASSAEAATTLLSDSETPSLVLLDLNLPGTTGLSVLRHGALSRPGHPPVVMMTGLDIRKERFAECDLAGFLPKPFAMETLLATVERLTSEAGPQAVAPDG
jgi:two-component system phosphate regulon response regulator PhoB